MIQNGQSKFMQEEIAFNQVNVKNAHGIRQRHAGNENRLEPTKGIAFNLDLFVFLEKATVLKNQFKVESFDKCSQSIV